MGRMPHVPAGHLRGGRGAVSRPRDGSVVSLERVICKLRLSIQGDFSLPSATPKETLRGEGVAIHDESESEGDFAC